MAKLQDGTRVYGTLNVNTSLLIATVNVLPYITSSYGVANAAFGNANSTLVVASAAFTNANATLVLASAAYDTANAAFGKANGAFGVANGAFGVANTALQNTTVTLAGTLTLTANIVAANGQVAGSMIVGSTATPAANLEVVGTIKTSKASFVTTTLTDGTYIGWDTANASIATVTLAGNRTFANASNLKVGTYILTIIQDAIGSRTATWNSGFKWPAGVAPTLTTTANAKDVVFFYSDGTLMYGSFLPDVR